ncbi:tetrahydrofolate dehydrogenase/cyclohydrolase catalytic domain-containing protein [Sporosalibacterium faouarense]|uniref:tetrahydrofolate dehydrogenase/cyclohydrolase catalytic domain-containing protein n=1 Tax=Sporosalibacterium faouarense TaxID=516123 RepID=UPI00141C5D61|nr:bifunctional 5,10-methylenetetrahydrofolate dehydrogenase/5,10-methenyltetrahydrofolate cyclohydrolase [Bacillota bacterium]
MGIKLDGKPVVEHLRDDINKRVTKLKEKGNIPKLLIIRVGNREDDISYEKSIVKNCKILGIASKLKTLPIDVSQEKLIEIIKSANIDKEIHGIMLFRPLPSHLDLETINKVISPIKDIDCMNPENLQKVLDTNPKGIIPCTPKAVVELLKYYEIPLKGASIAMVGKSLVVGKPLGLLLMEESATVTFCHKETKDVASITSRSDIVIAAIGKAKHFKDNYFNENAIVIDVGINASEDGKICGDVDYDLVFDKVKAITPTLGGIGIITTTILLSHVVQACEDLNI